MAVRKRSPTYPVIDLQESLDLVGKLYKSDKNHPVDREVAATNMGYAGLTGRSMGILSTLRQYGLLDALGESQIKVSDRAVKLLYPEDQQEKKLVLREAALSPKLFSEVFEKFGGILPSDANLMSYFVRQGFFDTTASTAIKVVKSTFEFAGMAETDLRRIDSVDASSDRRRPFDVIEQEVIREKPLLEEFDSSRSRSSRIPLLGGEAVRQEIFTVEEGEVIVAWPKELTLEGYQDVEDWMQIVLRKMKRASSN